MFTAGGQPDLHVVMRGGGGKGGGGGQQEVAAPPPSYVDPVNGRCSLTLGAIMVVMGPSHPLVRLEQTN